MAKRKSVVWPFLFLTFAYAVAIPTSLVEEIRASETGTNKVKRGPEPQALRQALQPGHFFNFPSATKRGVNIKNLDVDPQLEWNADQSIPNDMLNIPATLYDDDLDAFDGKTIAELEKGFQYGVGKDKLDEALENAVLKSELYGEPTSLNEYRYYGNENKKRKRRNSKLPPRDKRDADLTPEEILTIMALYENERLHNKPSYKQQYQPSYNSPQEIDFAGSDDAEKWYNTPVRPHANLPMSNGVSNNNPYYQMEKRGRWNGYVGKLNKRFMVAQKRSDPTRELRYLNGPNKNDYYTLSQLLNNEKQTNLPVHRRLVL